MIGCPKLGNAKRPLNVVLWISLPDLLPGLSLVERSPPYTTLLYRPLTKAGHKMMLAGRANPETSCKS